MAASRQGMENAVAKLQNKSHKCLVEIDGTAMLERVLQTLLDSQCFTRILVSIENEAVVAGLPVIQDWLAQKKIALVPSAANLADSLIELGQDDKQLLPLVITTADNALHTPQLIQDFVSGFRHSSSDVTVAATTESEVLKDYGDAGIKFFRFSDGGYSFCNLFGVRSTQGIDAARIFRSGGQFRKRPWRILKVFGVMSLIIYKCKLSSFESFFQRIAGKLRINIEPLLLPYAYGPIDVDNPTTFRLSEETLKKRRSKR